MKSRTQGIAAHVRSGMLAGVLAASLVASAGGVLAGCSSGQQTSQQAAHDAVASVTDTLSTDSSTATQLFGLIAFYPQDYGVSEDVFAQWYFDGADCQVSDAEMQGDAATVNVTFTAKRMADVLPILEHARDAALEAGADATAAGYANAQFEQATANAQVATEQRQVAVVLAKGDGGAWDISNEDTMAAALLDGYDPRQIDID